MSWPLSLRLAARELRGGVRGFRIFLACLAVGVAAIAAAGSTGEAFRRGLASESRDILGGDLAVSATRNFTPAERQAFERLGKVSYAAGVNVMVQAPSGLRRLADLRGVDGLYPLAGTLELTGADGRPTSLAKATAPVGGVPGAAVEQAMLDRLNLKLGDRFLAGDQTFVATAVLGAEPDRLSRGFQLGLRVLTGLPAVKGAGLLDSGLRLATAARIAIAPGQDPRPLRAALRQRFGQGGLRVRDRYDASPGVRDLIGRLEYFLSFIGLASLLAGGLGVSGAVGAYLEARTPSIAVLKALGAEGALIRNLYLAQIAVLAGLGVGLGVAIGAAAPFLLSAIAGKSLPVPALFAVYPAPLLRAAAFGVLSAGAFSLMPLARARATPPAALFRRDLGGRATFGSEAVGAGLCAIGLAATAVVTAPSALVAAIMIGAVAAAFVLLWLMGRAGASLAGRLRAGTRGPVRLGLANLAGPHSAARSAAPSVGLGVALLAAVVLIQSALLAQVREVAPKTAPALVLTEIPADRPGAFDAAVAQVLGPLGPANYLRMPMFTGRITALNGQAVERDRIDPSQRWAFDNDISMSAAPSEPTNAGRGKGRWWTAAYAGQPLVAISDDMARAGRLKLGDRMTVQALGRPIDASVAVIRPVDVGGFGPGFEVILDQQALSGAALRQVAIVKTDKAGEARLTAALGHAYPGVNVISVREQLEQAAALFDKLALAVRSAAAVAGLAGVLVLAGAIAAGASTRAREAALLKVLGAARVQVLGAYALEYGAVGLIAGTAGVALGAAAAWPVVVKVFQARWSVDWGGVFALVGAAMLLACGGGLVAAALALAQRPAPALRSE
ncbi:MAG TPA: FtsX-like permease family protein [Caulobacteraceae bacterium]|nr:FtsX-like permease family protein [Caulobacteraceae bacterium]